MNVGDPNSCLHIYTTNTLPPKPSTQQPFLLKAPPPPYKLLAHHPPKGTAITSSPHLSERNEDKICMIIMKVSRKPLKAAKELIVVWSHGPAPMRDT